jgi:hypothetical protein
MPIQGTGVPVGFFQPQPIVFWIVIISLALLGLQTHYPDLTSGSIILLGVLISLLRIKGDSPILLGCCLMQWLQVVTPVLYCDFHKVNLEDAFQFPEMAMATQLSLWGILALAVGMRVALGKWHVAPKAMIEEAAAISSSRLTRLWWIAFFIGFVASGFAWRGGGLAQAFNAMVNLKWVVFYVLAYRALNCGADGRLLSFALLLEFARGLLGFFGSFKEVLFMFLVAATTSSKSLTLRVKCFIVTIALAGLMASVFWSAVKMQYRSYLSMRWTTTSSVPITEKIAALKKISDHTEGGVMNVGIDKLLARLSYTQWFGQTISHVPSRVPHEGGTLLLDAVKHVLMPRILFPNKKILDDSARTARYTGVAVAGRESGTSIGIGYMAESYVDFGPQGMMVPIFFLGLLVGRVYRYFTLQNGSRLWGTAISTAVCFTLMLAYATQGVKILGGFLTCSLLMWALNSAFGKGIRAWLLRDALQRRT